MNIKSVLLFHGTKKQSVASGYFTFHSEMNVTDWAPHTPHKTNPSNVAKCSVVLRVLDFH